MSRSAEMSEISYEHVEGASDADGAVWGKAAGLRAGMEIAVMEEHNSTQPASPKPQRGEPPLTLRGGEGGVTWEHIVKIEHLPAEQVYDIEVEGTHNFIERDRSTIRICRVQRRLQACTTSASRFN